MQTSSPMTISTITLCVSSRKLHRNSNLNPALRYLTHKGGWNSQQLYITLTGRSINSCSQWFSEKFFLYFTPTEGSMRTANFDLINALTLLEYGLLTLHNPITCSFALGVPKLVSRCSSLSLICCQSVSVLVHLISYLPTKSNIFSALTWPIESHVQPSFLFFWHF